MSTPPGAVTLTWAVQGGLLFLEDIGERPYRIHRMLTQLGQAGVLARAGHVPVFNLTGGMEAWRRAGL